ncbi:MAG: DUF5685 family protein [Christensenellaceae bacterium]
MFGYISPDIPYLFVKDTVLYNAMYCGLCKSISKTCGQVARLSLSYDITFLSVLLHNLKGIDITIERQHCVEHFVGKRPMAVPDELTATLACINTVWTYYKITDDVEDEGKGKGRKFWFRSAFERAKRLHPRVEEIISSRLAETSALEKEGCDSPDRMADGTATMMKELSTYVLGEQASEASEKLFYAIGKWIYLIDALDDYDKDKKKGCFNVFANAYGAENKRELIQKHQEDFAFLFGSLFYEMRSCLGKLRQHFNHDLTDNIIMRGLPAMTEKVMKGEHCKNKADRRLLKRIDQI